MKYSCRTFHRSWLLYYAETLPKFFKILVHSIPVYAWQYYTSHYIVNPVLTPIIKLILLLLQAELSSSQQLVHSEYLQLLTALAVGLGLHTVLVSPPHPPHLPPPLAPKQWTWLSNFVNAVSLAESLTRRSTMPTISELQCLKDVDPFPPDAKYQPTVSDT